MWYNGVTLTYVLICIALRFFLFLVERRIDLYIVITCGAGVQWNNWCWAPSFLHNQLGSTMFSWRLRNWRKSWRSVIRFFLFGSESIGTSTFSVRLCLRSDDSLLMELEEGRKPNISVMEKRRVGVVASSVESIEVVRVRVLILGGFQRTSGSMSGLRDFQRSLCW